MERDTGEFGREAGAGEPAMPIEAMIDDAFDRRMASLPPPPGFDLTDEEIEAELKEAEADILAGRGYPHAVVRSWIETWGTPAFKPFHEWLTSSG